jgi:aerobic-type carbon monoxide dehydrogenase small subunit (CoxS/CutS family)
MTSVTMELNGDKISYEVEPRESLADFLRERCRLTATRLGCEHGACGSCTVAVDGKVTRSCLRLASGSKSAATYADAQAMRTSFARSLQPDRSLAAGRPQHLIGRS